MLDRKVGPLPTECPKTKKPYPRTKENRLAQRRSDGSESARRRWPSEKGAEAAPLVDLSVGQGGRYSREQQGPGSGLTFPKLFAKAAFHVTATELGGESRTTQADGSFANGATSGTIALTFPASGTVQVTVASDDPNAASLIASSTVTIVTPTRALTLFPGANGNITATGVQLGSVSATAVSQGLSASAGGTLSSRSVPLRLTLMLGRRITMAGHVEAEAGVGQPSVHTRVVAIINSNAAGDAFTIETRTDAAGGYSITGVPVGNAETGVASGGPPTKPGGDWVRLRGFKPGRQPQ